MRRFRRAVQQAFLLCCLCCGLVQGSQEGDAKKKNARAVVMYVDMTVMLQAEVNGPIREIVNYSDQVVRVSQGTDSSNVMVTGREPGKSSVTFRVQNGQVFEYDIEVRRRIALPVGVEDTLELPVK